MEWNRSRRAAGAVTLALFVGLSFAALPAFAEHGQGSTTSQQRSANGQAHRAQKGSSGSSHSQAASHSRSTSHRQSGSGGSGGSGSQAASRSNSSTAPNGVGFSGTIKIASVGSDTAPNNEPHPGCDFRVDFYGFRSGTYNGVVTAKAPSGSGTLATGSITITNGSPGNGYETSWSPDVSLAGLTPSNQGYHLRVDVYDPDKPGKGGKTKVFWLDCPAPAGAGSGGAVAGETGAVGGSAGSVGSVGGGVLGERASLASAQVLGEQITRSGSGAVLASTAGGGSSGPTTAGGVLAATAMGLAAALLLGTLMSMLGIAMRAGARAHT